MSQHETERTSKNWNVSSAETNTAVVLVNNKDILIHILFYFILKYK